MSLHPAGAEADVRNIWNDVSLPSQTALPSLILQHPEAFKHAPFVIGEQDVSAWVYLNYQHNWPRPKQADCHNNSNIRGTFNPILLEKQLSNLCQTFKFTVMQQLSWSNHHFPVNFSWNTPWPVEQGFHQLHLQPWSQQIMTTTTRAHLLDWGG